MILRK